MRLPIAALLLASVAAAASAEAPPTDLPAIHPVIPSYAFKPQVDDYYPSAARSLREQGTTTIRLCYDDKGRPDPVTVHESSGFERLDDAAVRWGKAVRITPGVMHGQAQPDCHKIPVKFSLEEKTQQPSDPRHEWMLPPGEAPPPPILLDIPPPLWPPPMPIPLAPSPPERSIPL